MDKPQSMKLCQWVQQEMINCYNPRCKKCASRPAHGPYWRGYYRDYYGRMHQFYIGKELPEELKKLVAERGVGPGGEVELPGPVLVGGDPRETGKLGIDFELDGPADFAGELGLEWPATQETVRKKVYNLCQRRQATQGEKNNWVATYARICRLMGWKLKR